MNRYNKLKMRILAAFAESGGQWLKPEEIAKRVDFRPRRSAWTYLSRLRRFGLLERRFSGKGTLQYRISPSGAVPLRWLRSQRC
jgi:DNA-binding IclR family transcriptional regulator